MPNSNTPDLVNQIFGRLVVVERIRLKDGTWGWFYRCECGNYTSVPTGSLKRGATRSCGCLRREDWGASRRTHGLKGTRVYRIWMAMNTRCTNPNQPHWERYGGRGVKVCDRWRDSFEAFLADMGEPPADDYSIDRIDNDGDYEPGNCRWASPKEQGSNKRTNHLLTHDGQTRTASEWSRITGIHIQTILFRLKKGWAADRALTERPSRPSERQRIRRPIS